MLQNHVSFNIKIVNLSRSQQKHSHLGTQITRTILRKCPTKQISLFLHDFQIFDDKSIFSDSLKTLRVQSATKNSSVEPSAQFTSKNANQFKHTVITHKFLSYIEEQINSFILQKAF